MFLNLDREEVDVLLLRECIFKKLNVDYIVKLDDRLGNLPRYENVISVYAYRCLKSNLSCKIYYLLCAATNATTNAKKSLVKKQQE